MDLRTILQEIREHYVDGYASELATMRAEDAATVPELLLELSNDQLEGVFKFFRPDFTRNVSGKARLAEFNQGSYLDFEPLSFHVEESLKIELNPMYWNGAEFRVVGAIESTAPLEAWIEGWLDVEDRRPQRPNGLAGVIHNVTTPRQEVEYWEISVDFGSAPVDAFWTLLKVLAELGSTEVKIGSFSLINLEKR